MDEKTITVNKKLLYEISTIQWYHCIDLGNGIVTPGQARKEDTEQTLKAIQLPADLKGKSVIDVGAWDGFFSYEAERRGADKVLAIDYNEQWDRAFINGSKKGFDLVHDVLKSNVESEIMSVYDISPEKVGKYDIVLFLGVIYHLLHPILALQKLFSITKELLIMETLIDILDYERPASVFYPGCEMNNDGSNYWGFNPSCIEAMLRTVGFKNIEMVDPYIINGKSGRLAIHARPE